MALTLTHHDDTYRVRIAATGLTPDEVRVERSTNQLLWTTVRGGLAIPPTSGAGTLDDWEYAEGAQNFYRVVDTADDSVEESGSITPSNDEAYVIKSIQFPFLNRAVRLLDRGLAIDRPSRTSVFEIRGRSTPIAVQDLRASQRFEHHIMTIGPDHLVEARNIDLMLASGGVFYLQWPASSRAPGGYVVVGDAQQIPLGPGGPEIPHEWMLPCTVVTPPGPDVVGTTMTFGALLNLYGSYAALLAANPTYADLLELMATPEDLVVL